MRRTSVLLLVVLGLLGCGKDPFGAPVRVRTHGYRAVATTRKGGASASFEIAVRGDDRRREPAAGGTGPVVILKGKDKKAFELLGKTAREVPFTSLDAILPGHPLTPGFDDHAEAARRDTLEYHRESDDVFAGHACAIWRFDDKPGDDFSPTTTYWVAPDLDALVVFVVRETPKPDGGRERSSSELTNVRANADPSLFEVPGAPPAS